MKNQINRDALLDVLANRIPEAQRAFRLLPDQLCVPTVLNKLFDETTVLLSQQNFKAVKRCLLAADELLHDGDEQVSTAVSTIYMYRLATVLYQQDTQSAFFYLLLPQGLRAEFDRHIYPDE